MRPMLHARPPVGTGCTGRTGRASSRACNGRVEGLTALLRNSVVERSRIALSMKICWETAPVDAARRLCSLMELARSRSAKAGGQLGHLRDCLLVCFATLSFYLFTLLVVLTTYTACAVVCI